MLMLTMHIFLQEVMHMVYNRDLSQRLFFAAVAIFSFTGNLFFVVLIVRNRKLMKNAYHVILLSLAITDMMTGKKSKGVNGVSVSTKFILLCVRKLVVVGYCCCCYCCACYEVDSLTFDVRIFTFLKSKVLS